MVSTFATSSLNCFNKSQKICFITLLFSQLIFVSYLAAGYGFTGLSEGLSQWNRFNETAYVSGDVLGNAMYASHVLLAIIMIVGGSLQLIPSIRNRFASFHRYNGRLFVLLACTISLAGMYLITVRGTVGNTLMHSLTFFSGAMVLVSSFFAVSAARRRKFSLHQRWALHLFLAANGVLFFRLFIFAWMIVFGIVGINTKDFTGPTVVSVSFLSYVAPHIFIQLLWFAQKRRQTWLLVLLTALLILIAVVFLIGLFGLAVGRWYPVIMA